MPYELFQSRFPDIAMGETRSVTTLQDSNGLPAGEYGFLEMFCDELDCDCRRAFFLVVTPQSRHGKPEAVIAYGWESSAFYKRWMYGGSARDIAALQGPMLNDLSPQSKIAPAILELFRTVLLSDRAYIARVKKHYRLFRADVDKAKPKISLKTKTNSEGALSDILMRLLGSGTTSNGVKRLPKPKALKK